MAEIILYLYDKSKSLVEIGIPMRILIESGIYEKVIAVKYEVANDDLKKFDDYILDIDNFYEKYKNA